MSLEKELKFPCQDLSAVQESLKKQGATLLDNYFEANQVFDTSDKRLKQSDILLRLREAEKNVLCLKRPLGEKYSREVKVWEEFETELRDPEQMRDILYALGYLTSFCYEKLREKWSLKACKICLDLLPFGRFLEIEGEMEEISECAHLLNMDMNKSSTKTYQQLNREHLQKQGLPEEDYFVFQEPQRSRLIERGKSSVGINFDFS